jgi:hypothetical protein
MMHEARADFTMLLGSIYLLIEDAGRWSVDAMLSDRPNQAFASLTTMRKPENPKTK